MGCRPDLPCSAAWFRNRLGSLPLWLRSARHASPEGRDDRVMLEEVLALVAPPACAGCGGGCELRRRVCERCDVLLRGLPPVWSAVPGLEAVWSAAPYE